MKKIILILLIFFSFIQPALADFSAKEDKAIRKLLNSQVKYANRANLKKLISTYDKTYISSDGFNLDVYSDIVADIWNNYGKVQYDILIKDISLDGDKAVVEVQETSKANILTSKVLYGELNSVSNSVYYLKKIDKKWKVVSDKVLDETTSLMYGEAQNLDIKMTVPEKIEPNTEYSASLEFVPPKGSVAIASLACDKIEYPQEQTKEVFRALPDDNILERLFTSNNEQKNEYIVASIGLTKTSIEDLNLKLSLIGFGYLIKRVNLTNADKGGF